MVAHQEDAADAERAEAGPEDEAKRYSTHSFRIFLACAAHKAGVPSAEMQALCRWRSPESLGYFGPEIQNFWALALLIKDKVKPQAE